MQSIYNLGLLFITFQTSQPYPHLQSWRGTYIPGILIGVDVLDSKFMQGKYLRPGPLELARIATYIAIGRVYNWGNSYNT